MLKLFSYKRERERERERGGGGAMDNSIFMHEKEK